MSILWKKLTDYIVNKLSHRMPIETICVLSTDRKKSYLQFRFACADNALRHTLFPYEIQHKKILFLCSVFARCNERKKISQINNSKTAVSSEQQTVEKLHIIQQT